MPGWFCKCLPYFQNRHIIHYLKYNLHGQWKREDCPKLQERKLETAASTKIEGKGCRLQHPETIFQKEYSAKDNSFSHTLFQWQRTVIHRREETRVTCSYPQIIGEISRLLCKKEELLLESGDLLELRRKQAGVWDTRLHRKQHLVR